MCFAAWNGVVRRTRRTRMLRAVASRGTSEMADGKRKRRGRRRGAKHAAVAHDG